MSQGFFQPKLTIGAGITAGHLPLSWVLAAANELQLRQHSDM
jgi:hypothetical protein